MTQPGDRNWKPLWDYVREVSIAACRRRGVHGVDVPLDFLAWKMSRRYVPDFPLSQKEDDRLKRQADNFARRQGYRLGHTQRTEVSLDELEEEGVAVVIVPDERRPGPEEALHQAELLDRLLAP